MRALVVYESMFGNTKQIAQAVAEGLAHHAEVIVDDVAHAPGEVPPDIDLVVLGGPTHAFSMSRPGTRDGAVERGADRARAGLGIREWLAALPDGGHPQSFAAFDTRVDMPLLPGAASRAATRVARRLGFRVVEPESFLVFGYEGPLLDGEVDRARAWGRRLGVRAAE